MRDAMTRLHLPCRAALVAALLLAALPAGAELVPPPPPGSHIEGEPLFLPQQPGRIRPWSLPRTFVVEENQITAAEFKALEANLRRVAEVITRAPVLNPPLGFDLTFRAALGAIESVEERRRFLAQGLPLHADIAFSAQGYYQARTRPETNENPECGLRLVVNIPPVVGVAYSDAEGEFFLEPRKDGELDGLPVYEDVLLVLRPGQVPWIPVGTERVLRFLMPKYKASAEGSRDYARRKQQAYQDFMGPAAKEKRRREAQALRAAGGSGGEENARRLESKQRRWEEDARQEAERAVSAPKWREPIENYQAAQARLAGLDAAGRAAPACVTIKESEWRVVPAGTPGCRLVVRSNPALLSGKGPRGAMQVMYARQLTRGSKALASKKYLRANPGDCVALAHLLRQVEWHRLPELLLAR